MARGIFITACKIFIAACGIFSFLFAAHGLLGAQSLNHWTAREVPLFLFLFIFLNTRQSSAVWVKHDDCHEIFFFFFWLCWVFSSVRGLSLVVASGGRSSSRCADLSLSWPLSLRSTGSRRAGSVVVAHGPSCSAACGIFPDQGSNPCPLHWQADSQPLRHQGSPLLFNFFF